MLTALAALGLTSTVPYLDRAGPVRLDPEESALLAAGLLPADYPALAAAARCGGAAAARRLAHAGLAGPSSADHGDPAAMLAAARYAATHPEYRRFLRALRPGDVVFATRNDPNHFITRFTGGPFTHVLLCTDAAPPGRFVEAIGATARRADPTGDQVRRTTAARYATDDATLRIVRPAAALPPERRAPAVAAAIGFAARQLGKPYNFAFSDRLGGDRAFYCSSLVLRAYEAAGVSWPYVRRPEDGARIAALRGLVLALELDDPVGRSHGVMRFLHREQAPDAAAVARYLADEVLPHARALAPTVATPERRARMATAIAAALAAPATGVAKLGPAMGADGLLRAAPRLGAAAWPVSDTLAGLAAGRGSPLAAAAGLGLDALDVLRASGLAAVPPRASRVPDDDFVSPSDLAWAALPHQDFNAKPGRPLDRRGRRSPDRRQRM